MSVQENQLTRHDDESFVSCSVESFEATIEQLSEFARIGRGWCISQLAGRVESDASLCGVGDDEANLWLLSQSHEGLILAIRIEGSADAVNAGEGVDLLTIQTSLQIDMIETILSIEPIDHASLNRLNHHHRGVEVGLLVHVIDNPIDKATQEIAFTKLDDSLRCMALRSRASVQCFK